MTLSERIAELEAVAHADPRIARDLGVIARQLERFESRFVRVAKQRSSWTRPESQLALALIVEAGE